MRIMEAPQSAARHADGEVLIGWFNRETGHGVCWVFTALGLVRIGQLSPMELLAVEGCAFRVKSRWRVGMIVSLGLSCQR